MGYIYKICNTVNNKVYIGMTTRTIEIRMEDRRKAYKNPNIRSYNFKLYKAMRKIGYEKFYPEQIEECSDELLDEKEKYWIEYYNSVEQGYNTALGRKGKPLITNLQKEAMRILYEHGWILSDISKVLKINTSDIGEILSSKYHYNTFVNSIKKFGKKTIGINKNNEVKSFDSITEAAKFIISNNISKSKNVHCVIAKISMVLGKENRTAYGYHWKTL